MGHLEREIKMLFLGKAIINLEKEYPNDMEFGKKIREIIKDINNEVA